MMTVEQADVDTIHTWVSGGEAVLIDVREHHEYAAGHIADSLHIPLSNFDINALPSSDGKHMVFCCAVGMRSQAVADQLMANGIVDNAINMAGGIQAWSMAGYPLET